MTIIIPHHTTAEKAIAAIDKSADRLFEGAAGSAVELTDRSKSWNGPVMDFSLKARVGFISVPLSGTVTVDDVNVTVRCELPAMVNKFIGEEKVRGIVDKKIRGILAA
jgi:hypothetical protein